jgi:pyruvate formate lyase activating enzyme
MSRGEILSIMRFSLHDGPGIRTTVFFKGCPLRCIWCHNPESQSINQELAYNDEKCTSCAECVKVCPNRAQYMQDGKHIFNRSLCTVCGKCAEVCMYDSLKLTGKEMSVDDVMAEVVKDVPYYASSGGGLTVSGGEPLMQPEFLIELLSSAKEKKIHTCIETCGFTSRSVIAKTMPLVDYYLFDFKANDANKHKQLTGFDNDAIIANLDYLLNENATVELRCPIVHGLNDGYTDLKKLFELEKRYPALKKITLMPYHSTGNSKYQHFGYDYELANMPGTSDEIKQQWLDSLKDLGSEKVGLS